MVLMLKFHGLPASSHVVKSRANPGAHPYEGMSLATSLTLGGEYISEMIALAFLARYLLNLWVLLPIEFSMFITSRVLSLARSRSSTR